MPAVVGRTVNNLEALCCATEEFASGRTTKWYQLAELGVLHSGLLDAVDCGDLPSTRDPLERIWNALSSAGARRSLKGYFREVNRQKRIDEQPPVDTERLFRNAKASVATAGAAVSIKALASGHSPTDALRWWCRAAGGPEPRSLPPLKPDWTEPAWALYQQLLNVTPEWPLGMLYLWTNAWLRRKPATATLAMDVPIAGTSLTEAFIAYLKFERLDSMKAEIVEDSDIALRPYGKPMLDAIRREAGSQFKYCVRWGLIGQDVHDFMPISGASLSIAVAAGIDLLTKGEPYDAGHIIIATRGQNGGISKAGDEKRKIEHAVKRRFRRAGVARNTELLQTDINNFRLRGLEVRLLHTHQDAVEFARGDAIPKRGIAAIVRRCGESIPTLVPITGSFSPSEKPSASVALGDSAVQTSALAAFEWTARYMKRFNAKSHVRMAFEDAHGRMNAPGSHVRFWVPSGRYESSVSMETGMILAMVTAFFRDLLLYDLGLPVDFPQSLIISAAGFSTQSGLVNGEEHISSLLRHLPFQQDTVIMYGRSQQQDLGQFPAGAPVRCTPMDRPEHFTEEILLSLMNESRSKIVQRHLSDSLLPLMREWTQLEDAIEEARRAEQHREQRLWRLELEIKVLEKKIDRLNLMTEQAKEQIRARVRLPLRKEVADALETFEYQIRLKASQERPEFYQFSLYTTSKKREIERIEDRRRLYRRLARLLHFDRPQNEEDRQKKIAWFVTLERHRYDDNPLYMEALEGALDPLGGEAAFGTPEERVAAWFDRLYLLRELRQQVIKQVKRMGEELESLGVPEYAQDEQGEQMEAALRLARFQYDDAWDHLNFVLGMEPGESVGGTLS